MKAVITGPRSGLTKDLTLPFMHIEVDLEELPKPGEVIILNSGSSYYVKYIMWWVDGPENEAYWSRGDYRTDEGKYQIVNIVVEPDNRRDRWGYPAGLEDGEVRGGDKFLEGLREIVDLAKSAGGLDLVDAWLTREEKATAERKAVEAAQEEASAELFRASYKAANKEMGNEN